MDHGTDSPGTTKLLKFSFSFLPVCWTSRDMSEFRGRCAQIRGWQKIPWLLLTGVLCVCTPGCEKSTTTKAVSNEVMESHQNMLKLLQEVHHEAQENHPFLGIRQLRIAKENLDRAKGANDQELSTLHGLLGQELLRTGDTKAAIAEMTTALELLEKDPAKIDPQLLQQVLFQVAVAHLRDGENANCVNCINGERCLFPIKGTGVHEAPEGSQMATVYLKRALELQPDDLKSRWLLNIAYMTLGEYPQSVPPEYLIAPEKFQGEQSPVGEFRNIARELGLGVLGCAGGVIVDDFDGDQDLDIFFSTWATDGQLKYFRNNGDGSFSDATEEANLRGIYGGLNLLHADYDNDGDLDVLVLRGAWLQSHGRHPKSLLQNDGTGRFWDVALMAGLGERHYPSQTGAFADIDLDGDLDLFVGNESYVSQLFENDGKGGFRDIAAEARANVLGFTKGCVIADYDGDDLPDIYVSNLLGPNFLLKNNGNRTFSEVALEAGVQQPFNSFAVWFWDMNNDGIQDLYAGSYEWGIQHVARDYLGMPGETEPDCFYLGTKEGRFHNATEELGFTRVTQPMGINTGDIDNDGYLDFYLGTGYVDYEGLIPNLLFHNRKGKSLADITFSANVGHLQKGHGVALVDVDQDGDQDIFGVMGGWFAGDAFARALFQNPGSKNRWLSIRLRGKESNSHGVGCRIRASFTDNGESRTIWRWVNSGGSFGSNSYRQHLGLGNAEFVDELEIYWPKSKITQKFTQIAAGQHLEITEGHEKFDARVLPVLPLGTAAKE